MPYFRDRITISLGIQELEVLQVEESSERIDVLVKRRQDYEICSSCGKISGKEHSRWTMTVRDMPISGKKVYLHVMKRRFRCINGCQAFAEQFRCLEKYQRQTKRYRMHLEQACRHSSIQSASAKEKVSYGLMERLYYSQAGSKAMSIEKQPLPRVMSIDEFSGKKRVRMHLGIADLSGTPRLWDVLETKECTAFIDYFSRYSKDERNEVAAVVHDMDRGLRSWTTVMFKRAVHIIDKFHLTRTLLKYQERVRKAAYRKAGKATSKKLIRGSYFLIKKRYDELSDKEKIRLEMLFAISKQLKIAYEFKEDFMRWYDREQARSDAESELIVLYKRLQEITHMKRFGWTLDQWWDEILNYFVLNRTNGFLEGMNNKIKTLKRQAYGYRSFRRFRVRILNECAFS